MLICNHFLRVCEWKFDVVALVRVHGLAAAGERFHWSREERRFQRERFSRAWFTPVSHRTRKQSRAEAAQKRRVCRGGAARAHCAFTCRVSTSAKVFKDLEAKGFGFQTKVKDRFLNQRRWTCWYSCRENMQVLSETASLFLLFFLFSFWKVIFAFYLTLHFGGFPYFLNIIIIWFLSVC